VHFGGGSGAFVSPDGLLLTNHHVAMGQLHKLSTPDRDYMRDGFFARSQAEEAPCPDLELRVLWSMEQVTSAVEAAIDPKAPPAVQNALRKAAIARLERESTQQNRLKSEVVELYQGGEYWLYRYRTFKDVRLVCAPEERAAFYGGDLDNFSYPRHDLEESPKAIWSSWRVIPARRRACARWPSSSTSATSNCPRASPSRTSGWRRAVRSPSAAPSKRARHRTASGASPTT
jgi:hypothetical protein